MPEESVMRAALVLFVAAFGLPSLTAADVLVPVDSVQKFVNIRAEPDVDSDVIGRLYQGDSMPLVQSVDDWHEIKIEEGLNGYISADWTNVVTDAGAQAVDNVVEPEPEEEIVEPEARLSE
jgi:SH3-like domain-containing protein